MPVCITPNEPPAHVEQYAQEVITVNSQGSVKSMLIAKRDPNCDQWEVISLGADGKELTRAWLPANKPASARHDPQTYELSIAKPGEYSLKVYPDGRTELNRVR